MRFPLDALFGVVKTGFAARKDSLGSVRVVLIVDPAVDKSLIATMRDAFMPEVPSASVRVFAVADASGAVRAGCDVAVILSAGSPEVASVAQEAVVTGTPTVVVARDAAETTFVQEHSTLLGRVVSKHDAQLISKLGAWIIQHTDRVDALASAFAFLRARASRQAIEAAAMSNAITGALVFVPGADFPVMAATQIGMMSRLASIHDEPLSWERAFEGVALVGTGLILRQLVRPLARRAGMFSFAVKGIAGGASTYLMGLVLSEFYRRGSDRPQVSAAFKKAAASIQRLGASRLLSSGRAA
ncbi:hypothetical protein K6V98_06870 [Collinsella sp. AGMB00827]|uniref:DUF697 domain-containing protein n=1 Tax=Collinsella ureilytica TaxID=2869515 RepID=A0ABS7MNT1_9ACTN|nr:hypothetical protein [Collinsella urealyticum]MBY4798065.1 hypothetical protein [Collinsella urealyticum]